MQVIMCGAYIKSLPISIFLMFVVMSIQYTYHRLDWYTISIVVHLTTFGIYAGAK